MESININKLNIMLKVAIEGKSLNLTNKTLISMSLIEKLNLDNINIIYEKIKQLQSINGVIIVLLNEAKLIDLSDIKKQFIYMCINNTNMYIYNQKFESCLVNKCIKKEVQQKETTKIINKFSLLNDDNNDSDDSNNSDKKENKSDESDKSENMPTYDSNELKIFINNTLNIYNEDIILRLLELKHENIVFNVFRKTKIDNTKKFIISKKHLFTDKNILFYLNKCN